jgi:hypothetical protein
MAEPSYIFFNKSLEQARRLGARGGKAHACNQRARRARMPAPLLTVPLLLAPKETTAQAMPSWTLNFLGCAVPKSDPPWASRPT